jgi:hypothetical protein
MTICSGSSSISFFSLILAAALLTSCAVDEPAVFSIGGARTGSVVKEKKGGISAEDKKEAAAKAKMAAAKAKEEAAREAAEAKAEAKEKADKLALAKKKEAERLAEEEAEAKKEAAEEAAELAEKKARAEALLAREKEKEKEAGKAAKLAAKAKADADRAARDGEREIEALASRGQSGGGFFSMLSIGTSARQYKSEGHEIFVNHALLPALDPSNAKIEVDLSDQRARVYREQGGHKVLVIETQISSGKSGHATPTGTFKIGEKLEQKQSTLYGTWVDGGGNAVGGSSEVGRRPSGASHFVGADMPYWMRINGGIGLHVGIVPDQPASHGCIRVPASIQPLIFSKVDVGTPVTVTH